jgi:hypothetical protein
VTIILTTRDQIQQFLVRQDTRYDSEARMLRSWQEPGDGFFTRVSGWVHHIRDTFEYITALLLSGDPERTTRAIESLPVILALQDQDPTSSSYGIWAYVSEEDPRTFERPDYNWADFCGGHLAHILVDFSHLLPVEVRTAAEQALGHAAWSIFRRNVSPYYTNIAIMGAGVTMVAGELLGEPRLLEYGLLRLRNVVAVSDFHDGLPEYNSPTYTMVALFECERIIRLVHHPEAKQLAERLRFIIWRTIAEHYHPGTRQWAGPHARAYTDYLTTTIAAALSVRTGVAISAHPNAIVKDEGLWLGEAISCPAQFRARFEQLPQPEHQITTPFLKEIPNKIDAFWGTTWFNTTACLGSVNHECTWTQRRPLIAFWHTNTDPAIILRLRVLRDWDDFPATGVYNCQNGQRVLTAFTVYTNMGDRHLFFDRPADHHYEFADLRIRYELTGQGGHVRRLDDHHFELVAGDYRCVLHTPPGSMGPLTVHWETGQSGNQCFVDGILYKGERQRFDLSTFETRLCVGLELLRSDQTSTSLVPDLYDESDHITANWSVDKSLVLSLPLHPHDFWFM